MSEIPSPRINLWRTFCLHFEQNKNGKIIVTPPRADFQQSKNHPKVRGEHGFWQVDDHGVMMRKSKIKSVCSLGLFEKKEANRLKVFY